MARAVFLGSLFAAAIAAHPSRGAALLPAAPASGAELVQAGQNHFNSGNYWVAISTFQAAVSQNPSSAEAYYWLGRSYFEVRDYSNAVVQAEKSVALDAGNSLYHQWLGRAYGEKAERERSFFIALKVKKEFERAVALNPSNISARRDLEEYCIEAPWIIGGSKDQAYAQVQAIAAMDPVEGHLALAAYYQEETKRQDLAENEYRLVLAAKPKRLDPYLEVLHFFQVRNKPSDMEATIQQAALISANDPRLLYYRGVSRVLSRTDSEQAEQYLKSFLAMTPDRSDWPPHASAREWLGVLYESQGKRADAAEQYREALKLDPGSAELRERLQKLEKTSP